MHRNLLVSGITVAVLAFLVAGDAIAATRDCYTIMVAGVAKRVCEDAPAWVDWNDDGDHLNEWDCRFGGLDGCNPCGNCHAPPKPGTRPTLNAKQHISLFKYTPKEGERIRWADDEITLVNLAEKLCIMRRSTSVYCFPRNSFIAKNPKGDIVGVATPATTAAPSTGTVVSPTPVKPVGGTTP